MTVGVYNLIETAIMMVNDLGLENLMKILTALSLIIVGLLVYLVMLMRRERPTEIVFAPMDIDWENEGPHYDVNVDPAEPKSSLEFKQSPYWDPDKPH
jgi:hypothetical protein